MIYYIKTYDGKIYKGKTYTGNWNEVWRGMSYGDKLYNPYTKKTVIGWNLYKQQMIAGQSKRFKK